MRGPRSGAAVARAQRGRVTTVAIAKSAPARIAKGKLGVYFAWGAFSMRDGEVFTDSHGDQIPDDEMVAGALSLAKSAQLGHEHDGTITGSVPLVMPLTEDVKAALDLTSPHAGLVVGFTPTAEVAKSIDESIAAGEPWQMSIEGVALAEPVAKSAGAVDVDKAEHKRTLRNLTISKIDMVKRGAHGAGTAVVLAKRATPAPAATVVVERRAPAMTDPVNGHQHLIADVEDADGFTSYEVMSGAEYGHSHPFVRLADGSLSIGEAAGHTHTVSTTGEATMADDLAKSLAAAQADVTKATAQTAAVLALPVDQFAYAKRLATGELAAYLAKSATERAAVAKPEYVAKSGEVFYGTDDTRLVSMAKAHDATLERLAKAEGDAQLTTIAKAAASIPHVKGASLLAKAVHGVALTAEERSEVLANLATVDATIAKVCQPIGSGAAPVESSAEAKLTALANDIAKTASVTFAKAYDLALESPAGAALYAQAEAEKRATARA